MVESGTSAYITHSNPPLSTLLIHHFNPCRILLFTTHQTQTRAQDGPPYPSSYPTTLILPPKATCQWMVYRHQIIQETYRLGRARVADFDREAGSQGWEGNGECWSYSSYLYMSIYLCLGRYRSPFQARTRTRLGLEMLLHFSERCLC